MLNVNVVPNHFRSVLEGYSGSVWSVALSADASMIVSGSFDKTVRIWNAATGECVRVLEGHYNYWFTHIVVNNYDMNM